MEASEQIDCLTPLPEDTADALLTEMRTPAPYEVPEKTKKKATGTRQSSQHQTLRELFDTTHKNVWKVLFKGAEVPPSLTEDRGLSAKRPVNSVSSLHLVGYLFPIA